MGRHWVINKNGSPSYVPFKGSPRDRGYVPYGRTDKGGGASKINWGFKGGDKRIRLWKKREPDVPVWRVVGGWTGGDPTPPGNVRAVKYVQQAEEPDAPGERYFRSFLEGRKDSMGMGIGWVCGCRV